MFQSTPYIVPYDNAGTVGLAIKGDGKIYPFDTLTKNAFAGQTFGWDTSTVYIPDSGTAKVSTKDATTGKVKSSFIDELQKILVKDSSGNVGVEVKNKVKLDTILEGASKILGLGSAIWDAIDPSRIQKRTSVISNNGTGNIPVPLADASDTDIVPVNKSESGLGKDVVQTFSILDFAKENITIIVLVVAVVYFGSKA